MPDDEFGFGRGRGRGGGPGFGPGPGHRGPGGGHGRGGRGGRRRSRVSRGEVRSTILHLLLEEPMHGYQIMQELSERSGGAWKASPGSIYPTLQLLADEGLVAASTGDGRNVFSLTDAGRAVAVELEDRPAWERFTEGAGADVGGLRRATMQLNGAVRQIAVGGGEADIAEARRIVTEARKAIYRLLADAED